jgi:4'-phosphopantetheinyl transferase
VVSSHEACGLDFWLLAGPFFFVVCLSFVLRERLLDMDLFLEIPRSVPSLEANQLHVWRLDLAPPAEVMPGLTELLSAEERDKAARFRFERDRVRYVAAHGGMRLILAAYVGADPNRLQFSTSAHGKPILASGHAAAPGKNAGWKPASQSFNLSHAGSWGLLAVGLRGFIGTDIERQRELPDLDRLAESVLSSGELAALQAREADRRAECFFQMWARKEAVVKAIGRGLGAGLREIEIDPADPAMSDSFRVIGGLANAPPIFGLCFCDAGILPANAQAGSLHHNKARAESLHHEAYYAAVACEDSLPAVVWQDWPRRR